MDGRQYVQQALDSGAFAIEDDEDGTFNIMREGELYDVDYKSYADAFDYLVSTIQVTG